ncbi:hypothetical protein NW768_004812 [Fusarium equiseti]|uniref:Uncharacterized protein n=1 Tax=Fusarium equiseti TaxID=61235 RepID=A0ABQ8RH72_FUSEQ|nr:hypothetical protein NW768_004812 [Fusarium equiseti]
MSSDFRMPGAIDPPVGQRPFNDQVSNRLDLLEREQERLRAYNDKLKSIISRHTDEILEISTENSDLRTRLVALERQDKHRLQHFEKWTTLNEQAGGLVVLLANELKVQRGYNTQILKHFNQVVKANAEISSIVPDKA